jgi:hypothetical protein
LSAKYGSASWKFRREMCRMIEWQVKDPEIVVIDNFMEIKGASVI